eukprot:CAMPEP_0197393988 /NCGR_PEP_ID=MMETSP1165-20131217/4630_1 /TAXON_ID=284809 /ORGANISM="Chrysocystis fragilis, Strain CCMP3189" /LENGTH=417 /DNA_ID=CAMNT_0042919669 /DNA_START=100 /DNA_END=1353 /DNA_ORIENTATION=+
MCSWGTYLVLYTWFVEYRVCDADDDGCAVELTTYWTMIYAASQFIGSPILGRLTDSVGRRPVLLVGCAVNVVGFPVMAFASNKWSYLAAAGIMGFLDATSAIVKATTVDFVATHSTIAGSDRDHPSARLCYSLIGSRPNDTRGAVTVELAVLNAHSVIGMIVGICLGELLYWMIGLRLAVAAAGAWLAPIAFVLFAYFPETRHAHAPHKPFTMTRRLALMLVAYFFVNSAVYGLGNVLLYYGEDHVGFGSIDVTAVTIEAFLIAPLGSFLSLRHLVPRFGYSTTFAGLSLLGASIVSVAFVADRALLYVLLTLYFFSYSTIPLANGPISSAVSYAEQGSLQGAVYALLVAATLAASEVSLLMYQRDPRSPFILTAFISLLAALLFKLAGDEPPGHVAALDDNRAAALPPDARPLLAS